MHTNEDDTLVRRITVSARREPVVLRFRIRDRSWWARFRRRARMTVPGDDVGEMWMIIVTLVLVGALVACLHHAVEPAPSVTGALASVVLVP